MVLLHNNFYSHIETCFDLKEIKINKTRIHLNDIMYNNKLPNIIIKTNIKSMLDIEINNNNINNKYTIIVQYYKIISYINAVVDLLHNLVSHYLKNKTQLE